MPLSSLKGSYNIAIDYKEIQYYQAIKDLDHTPGLVGGSLLLIYMILVPCGTVKQRISV